MTPLIDKLRELDRAGTKRPWGIEEDGEHSTVVHVFDDPDTYESIGVFQKYHLSFVKQRDNTDLELAALLRNSLPLFLELADGLTEIIDFKDGPEFHTDECWLKSEDTEEDGCNCGSWSHEFAMIKVKIIKTGIEKTLSKLKEQVK